MEKAILILLIFIPNPKQGIGWVLIEQLGNHVNLPKESTELMVLSCCWLNLEWLELDYSSKKKMVGFKKMAPIF
jgi:hypothetical protein